MWEALSQMSVAIHQAHISQIVCHIRDLCLSKKLYIALYLPLCLWLLVWKRVAISTSRLRIKCLKNRENSCFVCEIIDILCSTLLN